MIDADLRASIATQKPGRRLRILVHDYAGHPFQVQLSRSLASRGHVVDHLYSCSVVTPRGSLVKQERDPASFGITPIALQSAVEKGNLLKRRQQEIAHGAKVAARVADFGPDVVISSNSPLDSQRLIQKSCDKQGVPMVYWVQDLVGLATRVLLKRRSALLGFVAGTYYQSLERKLLWASSSVVAISSDFKDLMVGWGLPEERVEVIENWAPLEEMPVRPKENPWSRKNGLDGAFTFVYAGTLGMKHNPNLLLQLADAFKDDPLVRVVVVSEGPGRKWLDNEVVSRKISNVLLLDFQKFEDLPDVLGSADVVVAILEAEAGALAVPSKVMTYMCSQRALLLSVPEGNLAARVVRGRHSGLVSSPEDVAGFLACAQSLRADDAMRNELATAGRQYAEANYDIERITDRFEQTIDRALSGRKT